MKLSQKIECRTVIAALLLVAAGSLAMTIVMALTYRTLFAQPWQKTFVTELDYRNYTWIVRKIFFIVFPCIAMLNIWAALKVLKYARKIQEIG